MSSRLLIERLAQCDVTLLLLGPVAAAGDRAIDHEIMAVDERRFVAGQEHCGLSDVVGKNIIILAFYPADWSG